jgi:ADP-heptose:LPS heptosyltransferase
LSDRPEIIPLSHDIKVTTADAVVVLLGHLGDVLNATALLPHLAARHSRRLSFVTTRSCVPLLANNPHLQRILVADLDMPSRLSLDFFEHVATLARDSLPAPWTVYNLHFPMLFKRRHLRPLRRWARSRGFEFPVYLRRGGLHVVECWARSVGLEVPLDELHPHFVADPSSAPAIPGAYFVIANGGQTGAKRWPMPQWRRLVQGLRARRPDLKLVQLGGNADPLIDEIEDLRGRTTINESYHVLRQSQGCLTNDSFVAHLAAAAGCRTTVIFGSSWPGHARPLQTQAPGEVAVLGGDFPCTPCLRDWCLLSMGRTPCLAFPSHRTVLSTVLGGLAADQTLGCVPASGVEAS